MNNKKIYSILVAEDNTLNQKLITTILSKQGFNFKLVENGVGAWELFQQESFDLVLMDCQMPIMDGLEATQKIRSYEDTQGLTKTPIIAITANGAIGYRDTCLEVGMDDYVAKPFKIDELILTMNHWLKDI